MADSADSAEFAGSAPPGDGVVDAVFGLDAELRVTLWSAAAERLYGIDADAAVGRPFSELVTCHPRPRHDSGGPDGSGRPDGSGAEDLSPETLGPSDGPAVHVVGAGRRAIPVVASTVPYRTGPNRGGCIVVVRDDTRHVLPNRAPQERLQFETLLSEMSARFAGLPDDQVDGEIHSWLGRLAELLGVDRSSFAELAPAGGLSVTHSYAVPGIEPHPRGPAAASLPWLTRELGSGRSVVLTRIPDDLPDHALEERRLMDAIGMKAAIGIPLSIGGSLVCVLTFGAIRRRRTWPPEIVSRLRLAGEIFANAVARRLAKKRLDQKQQELAHVARVADMAKLAAVIAHELDQPLTAVVTNAQAVRAMLQQPGPDLAEADEALGDISDAAMRISAIVQRERRLLRKSQGTIERVDLNDALREVELFIRAEAQQCGATVGLGLLPGLPAVLGDRVQLQQVALNLARNALQAVTARPAGHREVEIRTAAAVGEVVLSVTDSGPPVEESLLEHMFEPFFTTKPNGLGIGLSISRSIVEGHRGRIWPTRNPGGGVTVHVSIPRE